MLNKSGPRIDPCGTSETNFSKELKVESTFVFCLRLVNGKGEKSLVKIGVYR